MSKKDKNKKNTFEDKVGYETLAVMREARFYNIWLFSFMRPFIMNSTLEIGGGIGVFSEKVSKISDLIVIDKSKSYIDILKNFCLAGVGDIETGKYFFSERRFDSVFSFNVFEHVKDDRKAFQNTYNLIKPGGFFCILVPSHRWAYSDIDKKLGHYRRYSKLDVQKKLEEAGFDMILCRHINFLGIFGWFTAGKILRQQKIKSNNVRWFNVLSFPFLLIEKVFSFPMGLSLYAVAQKPKKESKQKLLSIIIPVFNEVNTIEEIINKVKKQKLPGGLKKEIIVVDDGSVDRSAGLVKKMKNVLLIKNPRNMGKGYSIKKGLQKAKGDIVLIQDADLEYNPKYYPKLIRPILENKTSVVYGTRLRKLKLRLFGPKRTLHPQNYFANIFLSWLTNLLFGTKLTDMETCYKVFRRDLINPRALVSRRFEIEPELTALFAKRGEKILEVDIKVRPRSYKQGKKIRPRDGLLAVKTLFLEKFLR